MVKKLNISFAVLSVLLGYSGSAMARDFPDIYSECGLGAVIAPKNNAVAVVTNVTWDSGTTAISSNVSSPDTCKGKHAKTASLIHHSYEQIASDLSSGSGSYLDSLVSLSGYHGGSTDAFKLELRKGFAKLIAEPGYSTQSRMEKSTALYNLVFTQVENNS